MPAAQEGRGQRWGTAGGWTLLNRQDRSLDSPPGHAIALPDTPVPASPVAWVPCLHVPPARPSGWEHPGRGGRADGCGVLRGVSAGSRGPR